LLQASERMKSHTLNAAHSGTYLMGGDMPVHRLGFGAMRITGKGVWGPPSNLGECDRVLHRAVELGINLIDTAESYGPQVSEELIGRALFPYPKGLVIATKGGLDRPGPNQWEPNGRPERLREELEGSLKRLKLDRIDLWQLHRIDPKVPEDEQFGAVAEFRRQGKVRHVGLSEVDVEQIERARRFFPVVSVQNKYNIVDREWEAVVDYCERENIGFIPWFPLQVGKLAGAGGRLTEIADAHGATPAQIALAWLLRRATVMLPIPGTSKVHHLEENMGGGNVLLGDDEFAELAQGAAV
jgi:aryl-alcohol dehydrogenase-like predicted oxidoreductase